MCYTLYTEYWIFTWHVCKASLHCMQLICLNSVSVFIPLFFTVSFKCSLMRLLRVIVAPWLCEIRVSIRSSFECHFFFTISRLYSLVGTIFFVNSQTEMRTVALAMTIGRISFFFVFCEWNFPYDAVILNYWLLFYGHASHRLYMCTSVNKYFTYVHSFSHSLHEKWKCFVKEIEREKMNLSK